MRYFCGIDVGSLSTDGVLIDENENILKSLVIPTGASINKAVHRMREELGLYLSEKGEVYLKGDWGRVGEERRKAGRLFFDEEGVGVVATGYGRKRVDFAYEFITEITAHCLGVRKDFPSARTIIDIGGQDTKVIVVSPHGGVEDFVMNDKCSAGTGRFIEVMARILEWDLEEMWKKALLSERAVKLSSTCTVFVESEVISLIADGVELPLIARGIFNSIGERVKSMVKGLRGEAPFVLSGGVSKNPAIVHTLRNILKGDVYVPEDPQIMGALGSALYSLKKYKQSNLTN